MHPLEKYLSDIRDIHRSGAGVAEESYYAPLETLINEVGHKLKPRVRCIAQLANIGGGEPDFGLYTADQFQRTGDQKPIPGATPARGAIEAKSWDEDINKTIASDQVAKYLKRYNLVLVTNYRDFALVTRDPNGKPRIHETYSLADSATAFCALFAHPRKAGTTQGDRFLDYLRRIILHDAPLSDPENLAWFLASYAREARARIESVADLPALAALKQGLEEALGMKFEGDKGEHFFRATLVQTLFYGIFSSWVLWAREPKRDPRFDWKDAAWTLHVPMGNVLSPVPG